MDGRGAQIAFPVTLLLLDVSVVQRREGQALDTVICHHRSRSGRPGRVRLHQPISYPGRGLGHLLPAMADLPVDVLSVDWRLPLSEVRRIVGPPGAAKEPGPGGPTCAHLRDPAPHRRRDRGREGRGAHRKPGAWDFADGVSGEYEGVCGGCEGVGEWRRLLGSIKINWYSHNRR